MVHVSRNELTPFWGSHEFGQGRLEQLEPCLCAHQKDVSVEHPSVQKMKKLFRDAKVIDESTHVLKQFSCDACDEAEKTTASATTGGRCSRRMFNEVVSMDVNFWNLN